MKNKIKKIIAENLDVGVDTINEDLGVGDIPEWDSLAHVRIIIALEKEFEIKLDIEETLDIEDVADLVAAFSVEKSGD